ncbi:MAG: hypothetical protein PHE27_08525, partial [Alphaproteobacteria bacterium]|nr:hypothetical protein [Alphaproteobacteria bacterium]
AYPLKCIPFMRDFREYRFIVGALSRLVCPSRSCADLPGFLSLYKKQDRKSKQPTRRHGAVPRIVEQDCFPSKLSPDYGEIKVGLQVEIFILFSRQ